MFVTYLKESIFYIYFRGDDLHGYQFKVGRNQFRWKIWGWNDFRTKGVLGKNEFFTGLVWPQILQMAYLPKMDQMN